MPHVTVSTAVDHIYLSSDTRAMTEERQNEERLYLFVGRKGDRVGVLDYDMSNFAKANFDYVSIGVVHEVVEDLRRAGIPFR